MKKTFTLIALATAIVAGTATASADEFTVGNYKYKVLDATAKTVSVAPVSNDKVSGRITLGPTVSYNNETYNVTELASWSFYWCSDIEGVTLSSSITSLGQEPFTKASGLRVVVSENPTPPKALWVQADNVNTRPFSQDTYDYGTLLVPEGSIDAYKQAEGWKYFKNVIALTTTEFTVGNYRYEVTDFAKKEVTIYAIDHQALVDVVLEPTVTYGGSEYTITAIGKKGFNRAWNFKSFTMKGDKLVKVGQNAFADANFLGEINLPESVTTYGNWAFINLNNNFTSFTIGSNVVNMGQEAFVGCNKLTTITCKATTPPSFVRPDLSQFASNVYSDATLFVPAESVEAYKAADCWKKFVNIKAIPEQEFTIGNYKYVLTDAANYSVSVEAIDKTAVTGDIVMEPTVTYDGIEYTITSIADNAFEYATKMTSFSMGGESLLTVGACAFKDCHAATSIKLPSSVTSLGSESIITCGNLTEFVIPENCVTIGNSAFRWCDKITSIVIPDKVTTVGNWSFYNLNGLTTVTIGSGVTSIGQEPFTGCNGLRTVICNAVTPPATSYINPEIASTYTFSQDTYNHGKLIVPDGSVNAYQKVEGWKNFTNISDLTSSAVESIEAEADAAAAPVYNLQGIRVADSLDAVRTPGLYISAGRKVLVR